MGNNDPGDRHSPAKKHILVLDDEEGTRNILEKMIYRAGYNVSVVATGRQALQRFQSRGTYDLIISDIRTPLMTGIELMDELRKMGIYVPAIFISGSINPAHISQLKALGIDSIFVKPFSTTKLVERIKELIEPKDENKIKGDVAA